MNIHGKQVQLRAIEEGTSRRCRRGRTIPRSSPCSAGGTSRPTCATSRPWFATLSCQSDHQRFAIEVRSLGLVGTANLVSIDWKNRNAFHGMLLGDPRSAARVTGRTR